MGGFKKVLKMFRKSYKNFLLEKVQKTEKLKICIIICQQLFQEHF